MKNARLICALLAITTFAACSAGPHQLSRSVDDWDAKTYVESPWLDGVLHFIPVIPLAAALGGLGDFLITDAYSFWFKDAWDGKGTGFTHFTPKATDGAMDSLLLDDSHFMQVK